MLIPTGYTTRKQTPPRPLHLGHPLPALSRHTKANASRRHGGTARHQPPPPLTRSTPTHTAKPKMICRTSRRKTCRNHYRKKCTCNAKEMHEEMHVWHFLQGTKRARRVTDSAAVDDTGNVTDCNACGNIWGFTCVRTRRDACACDARYVRDTCAGLTCA